MELDRYEPNKGVPDESDSYTSNTACILKKGSPILVIPAEFPVIVIKLLVAVALRLEYAGVDGTGVAAVVIE